MASVSKFTVGSMIVETANELSRWFWKQPPTFPLREHAHAFFLSTSDPTSSESTSAFFQNAILLSPGTPGVSGESAQVVSFCCLAAPGCVQCRGAVPQSYPPQRCIQRCPRDRKKMSPNGRCAKTTSSNYTLSRISRCQKSYVLWLSKALQERKGYMTLRSVLPTDRKKNPIRKIIEEMVRV